MSDFDFVRSAASMRATGGKRPIWFVTGTDTDVGKTVVTGLLATAVREHFGRVTVVKPVQTGLAPGVDGDAQVAGGVARCASVELVRFALPADPWLAAIDAGVEPVRVEDLRRRIERLDGPLVVEGAGGILVPLNADESFANLASVLDAEVVVVVGLRLGCINHSLLTQAVATSRDLRVASFVLTDRWGPSPPSYLEHVRRVLDPHGAIVAYVPYDADLARSAPPAARA